MTLTVVQILPALEGGGVERGTLEVAAELIRHGHRSFVISAGGRMVEQLERVGSEHIKWDIGKKSLLTFRYILKLRKFLRENKIDVIHARSRLPAWIAWFAWKGMDKNSRPRFITTVHGLYTPGCYSSIMTKGEVVIAVSKTIKGYIEQNYPDVEQSRIRLIYRGVDEKEFPYGYKPDEQWLKLWYQHYPQLKEQCVLTLPGRLTRLKGHKEFIDLIGSLVKNGKQVYGLIVGDVPADRHHYMRELQKNINEQRLDKNIIFTGHRLDMREIYAVSDMVLSLSSKPESFGRTVLEALNLGTPVAGYAYGGVGEILEELYPTGCVKSGDRLDLVNTVSTIMENQIKVEEVKKYSLKSMLNSTINVYKEFA